MRVSVCLSLFVYVCVCVCVAVYGCGCVCGMYEPSVDVYDVKKYVYVVVHVVV